MSSAKPAGKASGGYASTAEPSVDELKKEVTKLRRLLLQATEENVQLQQRVKELEAREMKLPEPGGEPDERDRQRVLDHLRSEAFCHLFASPIAGVGVRAFRQIPAGVDPFPLSNPHMAAKERFSVVSAAELRAMPECVYEQVKSFFAPLTEDDGWTPQRNDDGEIIYGVLATGLNSMNLSWYLNHSDDPNIEFKEAEDDGGYNSFVTRRKIEVGEELTTNYKELGKEFYALVAGEGAND
eukprot:TRINITY_DN34147_c0_g1_i1.p1 TRINITY_DN34147_c0_g1~~TRINITY_DN34147_c0_g1_i1.p1  ORF type:complete len:240 (+),score=55.93 TRINITY_DN34147_c0_g1_i1:34-753(+)